VGTRCAQLVLIGINQEPPKKFSNIKIFKLKSGQGIVSYRYEANINLANQVSYTPNLQGMVAKSSGLALSYRGSIAEP